MLSDEFVLLQRAVAGGYSVVEEIGRGGMGVVFAERAGPSELTAAIERVRDIGRRVNTIVGVSESNEG